MKLWICIHHHRHGVDVLPYFGDSAPSEKACIDAIDTISSFEPDAGESIEIRGPFDVPLHK